MREKISNVIFAEENIPGVLQAYERFVQAQENDDGSNIKIMRQQLKSVEQRISNLVNVISQTGNATLVSELQRLENKKNALLIKIYEEERKIENHHIDPEKVISTYRKARELFLNGTMEAQKQLYNLLLDKVVVYPEYVEVFVRNIPQNIKTLNCDQTNLSPTENTNNEQTEKSKPTENCFGTGARTTDKQEKTEPDQWSDSVSCGGAEGNRFNQCVARSSPRQRR